MVDSIQKGNSKDLAPVFDEITRQLALFKNDQRAFKRYISEFSVDCLSESFSVRDLTNCTPKVSAFVSEVLGIDIETLTSNDQLVKTGLLEANMAGLKKFKSDSVGLQISVNNEIVKVVASNEGEITRDKILAYICSGFSPKPQACVTSEIVKINQVVSRNFDSRMTYEYKNFSVYLTLLLTLVFLVYIVHFHH